MKFESSSHLGWLWIAFGASSLLAGLLLLGAAPRGFEESAWIFGVIGIGATLAIAFIPVGMMLIFRKKFSRPLGFAVCGLTFLVSLIMILYGLASPLLMVWGILTLILAAVSLKKLVDYATYERRLGAQIEKGDAKGEGPITGSLSAADVNSSRATNVRIFISYRRNDSDEITGRIYEHLTARFAEDHVFRDIHSIPLGDDFRKRLDAAVAQCDVLLAIIGSQWLTAKDQQGRRRLDVPTDFVRLEIEAALRRRIPVIPVTVHRVTMPQAEELPETIRDLAFRNGLPVRPDPDFRNDMNRLISALRAMVPLDPSSIDAHAQPGALQEAHRKRRP